jgi:hypothetical protein
MGRFNEIDHLSDRELLLLTAQSVDGINARLDKLNGSVGETKKEVAELKSWRDSMKGGMTVMRIALGSGGAVALIALIVALVK